MILSIGILCLPAKMQPSASSPSWLKETFRFVTVGIISIILAKPSLDSLFFTSLSPLIFLIGLRYLKTSSIYVSIKL